MRRDLIVSRPAFLCAGFVLGAVVAWAWSAAIHDRAAAANAEQSAAKKTPDAAISPAGLEALKKRLPDQSHAMQDVGEHFTNLWFAASAGNWPLADFYCKETRSHLRWAVGIIPVRKDNQGREVNLVNILESLEIAPLAELQKAIEARDQQKFDAAYRFMLSGCYGCHKASEKPYLRPQIPQQPAGRIINFDPKADWPK